MPDTARLLRPNRDTTASRRRRAARVPCCWWLSKPSTGRIAASFFCGLRKLRSGGNVMRRCYEHMNIGDALGRLLKGPLTSAHLLRWSAAMENWHKIHYDRRFAVE